MWIYGLTAEPRSAHVDHAQVLARPSWFSADRQQILPLHSVVPQKIKQHGCGIYVCDAPVPASLCV